MWWDFQEHIVFRAFCTYDAFKNYFTRYDSSLTTFTSHTAINGEKLYILCYDLVEKYEG